MNRMSAKLSPNIYLKGEVRETSHSHREGHEPCPVADGQGEPSQESVRDGKIVEIVGDRLLDQVGHTVHDDSENMVKHD